MVMNRKSFPGGVFRLDGHNQAVGGLDHPDDAAGYRRRSRRSRQKPEGHDLPLESADLVDVHAADPPPAILLSHRRRA